MVKVQKKEINDEDSLEEAQAIYNKGEIVAIYHEKYNKFFTLVEITEDVMTREEKIRGNLAIRGNKENSFYIIDGREFDQKDVLGYLETAKIRELKSNYTVTDAEGKSHDSCRRIRMMSQMSKRIASLAQRHAEPEQVSPQESDGDDEEEEEEATQNSKKSNKKIVGAKKGSKNPRSRRSKKSTTGGDKGKKATKRRSKSKKAKVEKYKKGKSNPFVKIREKMLQLDNQAEEAPLNGSVLNNNRELIRAVNIGSIDLYKKIAYGSEEKISRLTQKWGIDNETTPFKLAIIKNDIDMLTTILESYDTDYKDYQKIKFTVDPVPHINKIETGFNDKYAYGVVTRTVNVARGNKQGNNAFILDSYKPANLVSYNDCNWLMKNNSATLEHIKLVISFFPNLRHNFLGATKKAILAGNNTKAAYFIEQNLERDSSTFNKYHRLALISKTQKSLEGIPKRSVTKQATNAGNYCPIHCACINPNVEVLKYLLSIKPEYNVKDEQGRKPVHYAACCESAEPIKHLIENNSDTRDIDLTKKTPLMYAAEAGRVEVIKVLLGPNRSNIEAKDKSSYTAIHYAAISGHVNAVEQLLIGGADINKGGPHRKTALHLAAQNGDIEMVEFLIQKGARRTSKDKFKRTALILAVMNGNLKAASILLKYGAPFDQPDSSDNYPLHFACAYGYPEMIDLLIEAGCDPNKSNSWRLNAVTVGLLKNYFECVRKMLSYPQTEVDCIDNDGRSLLSNTVKSITEQSYEHFIFLLEEKSADPNCADRYGLSIVHHLCRITVDRVYEMNYRGLSIYGSEKKQKMRECKMLYKRFLTSALNHGADINLKNLDGIPPIFLALQNKNVDAIEILLEHPQIKLDLLTKKNESIFHYLTDIVESEKFVEILEKILEMIEGVDAILNKVADSGKNAVHHIVQKYVSSHSSKLSAYRSKLTAEAMERKKENIQGSSSNRIILQEKSRKKMKRRKESAKRGKKYFKSKGAIIAEYDADDEESFNGLKGGARTRYFKKKMGSHYGGAAFNYREVGFSSHNYQNTNYSGNHNYSLTKVELDKIEENAEQMYLEATHSFIDVLRILKKAGADFSIKTKKPVIKDKERSDPVGGKKVPVNYGIDLKSTRIGDLNLIKRQEREQKTPSWVGSTFLHLITDNSDCIDFYKYFIEEANVKIGTEREDGKNELLLFMEKHPYLTKSTEVFDYLISKGIDINHRDKEEKSAFFYSCERLNQEYMTKLLQLDCEIDIRSESGSTPLIVITKTRSLKLVEKMLDAGADINFCDSDGRNALHWAVNNSSTDSDATNELENLLLSSGVFINKLDKRKRTALHYAFVKIGNPFTNAKIDPIETVSNILSRKEAESDIKDQWGYTPLHYAAQRGSVISSIYLLKNGAHINSTNEHGNTPLNISLINNHKELAIFFIQNEQRNQKPDLSIPVKVVTLQMQREKLRLEKEEKRKLEEKKKREELLGKMDIVEGSSESEIQSESEEREYSEEDEDDFNDGFHFSNNFGAVKKMRIVKHAARKKGRNVFDNELVEDDLDFNQLAETVTCFMLAIRRNWQGVAFLMLECGFDLSLAILDCFDALKFNYVYTLLLKKSEANVYQIRNENGQNISHLFCKYSARYHNEDLFNKIYSKIKSKKIDFSLTDNFGKNCLHYAAESGNMRLCEDLLKLGLSIGFKDKKEDTPFSLLIKKSYHKLREFIDLGIKFDLDLNQTFKFKDHIHRAVTYVVQEKPKSAIVPDIEFLKSHGADINLGDQDGITPLMMLVRSNMEAEAIQFDTDLKPDCSVVDKEGRNIIHHIVKPMEFGYYQNTNLLRHFGEKADIDMKDNKGHSPIYYAAQQQNGVMKEILMDLEAEEYDIEEHGVRRVQSSLLNGFQFPEVIYDFQSDYEKYNKQCLEIEKRTRILDEENRVKPHRLVTGGEYSVVYDGDVPYNLFMVKVEISRGYYSGNTFYRMQLLKDRVRGVIILFTNWGRTGDDGQYQHTPFGTIEEGKKEFEKIFKQKSGNQWADRDNFEKKEKKYRLVTYKAPNKLKNYLKEFNYNDPDLVPSKLDKDIYRFIRRVCNAQMLFSSMRSFHVDTDILPYRNLTKDRLEKADKILRGIGEILNEIETTRRKGLKFDREAADLLTDMTNEFYELIPNTRFRTTAIPPIYTKHQLNQYTKMISDLLYCQVVIRLLCGAHYRIKEIHPIDYCFNSLSFKIMRVPPESGEFKLIRKFVKNGYQGHVKMNRFVSKIFAVERRDERENISEWDKYGNKMMLWHGTRPENLIGILQTGLRIAPSNSTHSGGIFGQGIYFSDFFAKSYNYTNSFAFSTNRSSPNNHKYMLLCEVALGKQKEFTSSTIVEGIPNREFQSVKGIGQVGPDFAKSVYLANGCMVPAGRRMNYPLINRENRWNFLSHNEYVVYDPTQVRIKYVLELRD